MMTPIAVAEEDVDSIADDLRAPFPWFGGKRRVADLVWERLGDVDSYNEPFAGSLAVLLGRPHDPRVETVNDLDCYLANFWRALQHEPDAVAYYADGPVNEADLHARHRWLVEVARPTAERVKTEPDFYDVRIAGWWVWGQCLWIGSGWCQSPNIRSFGQTTLTNAKGVHAQRSAASRSGENPHKQRKRPAASRTGTSVGVHRQQFDRNGLGTSHQRRRPHLTSDQGAVSQRRWQGGGQGGGSGVHAPRLTAHWRLRPDLSAADGRGVHASRPTRQIPSLSGDDSGSHRGLLSDGVRSAGLYDYLESLALRLRRVRVCCGDWKRVLTPSVTTYIGTTGVFLDPPYSHDLRERCYSEDHDISAEVRAWALANGDDPKLRIALCGYEGEHEMPESWECVSWKAHGGYSRSERGVANRDRERIWFSPHCRRPGFGPLFEEHASE